MTPQEPTYLWEETPAGLRVTFPAPASAPTSVGCAVAFLVAAMLLALALILPAVNFVTAQKRPPVGVFVFYLVVLIACALLIRYALRTLRDARTPAAPTAPSILRVEKGELLIERVGHARDLDVSWQLEEIADVRLCAAAPRINFLLLLIIPLWAIVAASAKKRDCIRISVERNTKDIDDVLIVAEGHLWTDSLEQRLRAHLGLR